MAIITKSNISGNWNATSSWVGGVIPTSADDVVFDATSAGVILNVSSSVKSLDMTGFVATFTQSANLVVLGTTDRFGTSYLTAPITILDGGWARTSGTIGFGGNTSIQQLDTTTRFNIETATNVKLFSDWWIIGGRMSINGSQTLSLNGYRLIIGDGGVNGGIQWGGGTAFLVNGGTYAEDNIIIDCGNRTLTVSAGIYNFGVKLVSGIITPGYGSQGFGLDFYGAITGFRFTTTAGATTSFTQIGGTMSNMSMSLRRDCNFFIWKGTQQLKYFFFDYNENSTSFSNIIRLDEPLNTKYLGHFIRPFDTGANGAFGYIINPNRFKITGTGGVSASIYTPSPQLLTINRSSPNMWAQVGGTMTYIGLYPRLSFTSDAIHKIGKFVAIGLQSDIDIESPSYGNISPTFSSLTASVPATIQLGQTGVAYRYGFKDLNFTGNTLYTIDCGLENTTGATTSISGGGGSPITTAYSFIQ